MGYLCLFIHVLFEKTMFYLYFSLFNKNIHEVKNIAIRIVSCHTYRDTYRIVKMCIVTSLPVVRVHSAHCEIPSNNVIKINILFLDARSTFYWPTHVNFNVFLSKYHCSSSATLFIIEPTAILKSSSLLLSFVR